MAQQLHSWASLPEKWKRLHKNAQSGLASSSQKHKQSKGPSTLWNMTWVLLRRTAQEDHPEALAKKATQEHYPGALKSETPIHAPTQLDLRGHWARSSQAPKGFRCRNSWTEHSWHGKNQWWKMSSCQGRGTMKGHGKVFIGMKWLWFCHSEGYVPSGIRTQHILFQC